MEFISLLTTDTVEMEYIFFIYLLSMIDYTR